MPDRDRTDIDDIEFEFFDDPPTTEAAPRAEEDTVPPRRSGGPPRGPRRPRPQLRVRRPAAGAPLLRLALLGAALVVLVLLLVLGVRSCGGGKDERFGSYLDDVRPLVTESQELGSQALKALVTRALPSEVQRKLLGLAEREEQLVAEAASVEPPQELAAAHEALVQALDFRAKGLTGLSVAFGQLGATGDDAENALRLAQQASRLIASDVVYQDLFLTPTATVLKNSGVSGIEVPASRFVSDAEQFSESSFEFLVQTLGSVGEEEEVAGKAHGSELVGVRAKPDDIELSPGGADNRLDADQDLAFEVEVRNAGDFVETAVRVRLTINSGDDGTTLTKEIDVINPDDIQAVRFEGLADVITLGAPVLVKVAVLAVEGEELLDNNAADYRVFLSF